MSESDIESAGCKRVKDAGGTAYKFVSPGRVGVPDRLNLLPIPEPLRELVGQFVWFTEYKAPGEKPKPWQVREHERLRKLGFKVEVVDGCERDDKSV